MPQLGEEKPNLELKSEELSITLSINHQELKRMPDQRCLLICNHQMEELDKWVLTQISQLWKQPMLIFSARKSDEADTHILKIDNQLADSMLDPSLRFIYLLELAIQQLPEDSSLAIPINFTPKLFNGIRRTKHLHMATGVIKKFNLPIIPIHLVQDDLRNIAKLKQRIWNTPLKITARIGSPIPLDVQHNLQQNQQFLKYLQSKIYALGTKLEIKPSLFKPLSLRNTSEKLEPIDPPSEQTAIEEEIQQLTYQNLLTSRGQFDVFIADAIQIPVALQEIGRLREITFRIVGEGTGKSKDLDEYDLYYKQFIIWDREAKRIVGGYRLGEGDVIFRKYGIEGFYIHNFFEIEEAFYPIMEKAVELGRSYIVEEYQRQRLPLFLLWKGILHFLLSNPQYQYLYGPMSISKYYSDISRSVIMEYVKKYYFNHELAQHLTPRTPFQFRSEKVDINLLIENMDESIRSLDSFIEDIEPSHFSLPVLLKQYLKLNAKFISFNVDPNFSDVLDGFILLNLNDVPYAMIDALKGEK
ncbi:MAG: GNAT family N-acetyltransferase [Saprospiraceae bacterium]|nr:GNAT family N-acetyltransferase [Saprospiraceae bacterium]